MENSTLTNYNTSFEHITTRRPKFNRDLSTFSISGEHTIFNSTILNCSQSTSCPNITEKMHNTSQEIELQNRIMQLESELESANNEISELMIQNSHLKKSEEKLNGQLELLKKVTRMDFLDKPIREKNSGRFSLQTTPNYRNLNYLQIGLPRTTPNQMTKAVCDKLEESYTSLQKNLSKDTVGDLTSITTGTPIQKTISKIELPEKLPVKDKNEKSEKVILTKAKSTTSQKPRVLIIGDEKCRDLRASLQKLLGENFMVTAAIYPKASITYILDREKESLKTWTKNDFAIFFGCTNDKNPFQIMSFLNFWIMSNQHTNIIIPEIPYSRYLNRSKLNYEIKFMSAHNSNVQYIDMSYSSFVPKSQTYFALHLSRNVLRTILRIKNTLNADRCVHNQNHMPTDNKITVSTQTDTQTTSPSIASPASKTIGTTDAAKDVGSDTSNQQFFRLQ